MKKIMIIAGEASGDLHGANLVREIKKQDPAVAVYGVGSSLMRDAGVQMLADASEISVVGITEVLTHIGAIYRVYFKLKNFLREERPDLLVLIDFPDFNIMIGKAAKKFGIPILYYISPQVWAWRTGRVKTIANLVKAMIVVFPFETEFYRKAGVDVRFVGHPLTDAVRSECDQEGARKLLGLETGRRTVALLPGSRNREIINLLPDMLAAAGLLKEKFPDLQFILPVAHTLRTEFIREYTDRSGAPVRVVEGKVYDSLRASDAAIVASGTATLETGLMEVPMVVVYRVSPVSFTIVRMFAHAKYIGLVNIVANRRIVPELIQRDVTPHNIAAAVSEMLDAPVKYRQMKDDLRTVRSQLGESGASARAASVALEFLEGTAQ